MNPRNLLVLPLLWGLITALGAAPVTVKLDIQESVAELGPGLRTKVWAYNGVVPGTPIVVNPGDDLRVEATNRLKVTTSIHWHGLEVPHDQDGTMAGIEPGQTRTYRFTVPASGTYWYHSHTRPVLDQVDLGLYGTFIVRAPEDARYSSDQTFVLDDWYLGARGERLKGTGGTMERQGNVETVNGKTGDAIPAVKVQQGQLHKFRFINASTAAVHTLKVAAGRFRVTHTDGHPLTEPYLTDTLVLQPAERFDVEYAASGAPGSVDRIESDRDLGLSIPIVYGGGRQTPLASPFSPPASRAFGVAQRAPDFTLVLDSRMAHQGGHGSGTMPMEWTINGRVYPDTERMSVAVGQVIKVKFVNNDTQMMHPMDHPVHLHGTFFQVLTVNGRPPARETWKDTIAVPAGGTVEVAFRFPNPGMWMLHCHILDHEDGGMMTVIEAKN